MMDHAAAHERIEDLLLEPARLAGLSLSQEPDDVALREHLAGCPSCAADLDMWRRLQLAIDVAVPGNPREAAAATAPIELPPSLRARVLASVRETEQPGAPIAIASAGSVLPVAGALASRGSSASVTRRGRRLGSWLGLAAGIGLLAGTGMFAFQQVGQRSAADASARELAAALAIVDRMLATEHKVVQLQTTAGEPAGTISWSRHDWVVLTTALAAPPSGQEYLCWLEADGRSMPIGHMDLAGGTAYWVATLDEWQTWEIGPTTRFVVTLEPLGAKQRSGETILEAMLAT